MRMVEDGSLQTVLYLCANCGEVIYGRGSRIKGECIPENTFHFLFHRRWNMKLNSEDLIEQISEKVRSGASFTILGIVYLGPL